MIDATCTDHTLSEHDEALWRAALLADIAGVKKMLSTFGNESR